MLRRLSSAAAKAGLAAQGRGVLGFRGDRTVFGNLAVVGGRWRGRGCVGRAGTVCSPSPACLGPAVHPGCVPTAWPDSPSAATAGSAVPPGGPSATAALAPPPAALHAGSRALASSSTHAHPPAHPRTGNPNQQNPP